MEGVVRVKKVKKEKGIDPEHGGLTYIVIELDDAQELLYDLLIRIAEKVNA